MNSLLAQTCFLIVGAAALGVEFLRGAGCQLAFGIELKLKLVDVCLEIGDLALRDLALGFEFLDAAGEFVDLAVGGGKFDDAGLQIVDLAGGGVALRLQFLDTAGEFLDLTVGILECLERDVGGGAGGGHFAFHAREAVIGVVVGEAEQLQPVGGVGQQQSGFAGTLFCLISFGHQLVVVLVDGVLGIGLDGGDTRLDVCSGFAQLQRGGDEQNQNGDDAIARNKQQLSRCHYALA